MAHILKGIDVQLLTWVDLATTKVSCCSAPRWGDDCQGARGDDRQGVKGLGFKG